MCWNCVGGAKDFYTIFDDFDEIMRGVLASTESLANAKPLILANLEAGKNEIFKSKGRILDNPQIAS